MSKRQINRGTALGVFLAISGVVGGMTLDGGSFRQILQPTAAIIVLMGTLGAILIQFSLAMVLEAGRQVLRTTSEAEPLRRDKINELVTICNQVHRHGILSLDPKLHEIEDDFLRKALTLAVDGVPAHELRDTLSADLDLLEEEEDGIVQVLEAAGGFAPTLGIVGAVLGLIQVMQRMNNVAEIGKGIAVAFVSTLYGIGFANLCFLPLAGKLRLHMRHRQSLRYLTLDAVVMMREGASAGSMRQRLAMLRPERVAASQGLPIPEMATR